MYDDLTKAAIQSGTDKFGLHDYTPNYHKIFAHLRTAPIRVLEIGVGGYADDDRGGQSLEVWRDYFSKAQIVGIDIQKKTMNLGSRVSILQGSQVDPHFLDKLVKNYGPFDIIIDDGSHRNEHIVKSYQLLFPTLVPGGIYVAEDVQTSFHPRFGGSLEMAAPNSVGYFGQIAQGLSTHSDDPLIHNIAAIERFHNMIVMHKKRDGMAHDVFASKLFKSFGVTAPRVTTIGDIPTLPFATKPPHCARADNPIPPSDLLIVNLTDTPSIAQIETWFDTVADNGVMVVRSDTPTAHFGTDTLLGPYIQHRFTMLDHVEILVHYPEAPIDVLAAQIYSLERYTDALVLHKAPNTYPSNFAFDASNAQAAAAIAHMGEVLKDSDHIGGLVLYASILARNVSTSASAPPIQRLTAIGATSREYYQMAGALARFEKRVEDAQALFTTALQKFPYDPQFSVMLAAILANRRQPIEAESILRSAYQKNPRARNVVAALARTLEAKSNFAEAKILVESTINLFPQYMRPARLEILHRLEQTLNTCKIDLDKR